MSAPVVATKGSAATREGYGQGLLEAGDRYGDVVVCGADLNVSLLQTGFRDKFPDRFFNFGISEGDMVCAAAGLAACGKVVFAGTFAIFTERAFEPIRNTICRQKLDVKIAGSHAGLMTGEDGSSAQAIEDIAIYRALPNMRVLVPADATEARMATVALARNPGPTYIRLTRGKVPVLFGDDHRFELGKGQILRDGTDATILACGPLVHEALKAHDELAAQGTRARVVNLHTVKPLDTELVVRCAKETGAIVTAEDHSVIGGLGGAVAEVLAETRPTPLVRVGVKDTFGESGKPSDLFQKYGLTAKHVAAAARAAIARK
ncbi:MAG TPA: transketolase C-terminal domain-containing protein [Candidatus Thermoplasmatota archaeon]|nr:transketolase C-terminal domain-containing protein [Candidatus Thermoplasmatota archaeon]